ncbi:hypothetical protein [Butyrivibrio sp. MB2005]|uniref:hypothetical protein n=1 Tax=Butyrivibrio sp. MB2005 TaxID=1280678 RepID=UPI000406D729|nr:hypothetical protein [Butyrivibrio sp. MB2005]
MLSELAVSAPLGGFSRPNTPNEVFIAYSSVGNGIFGAASQNVTNCGSSMVIDTPSTYPFIKTMFSDFFDLDSIQVKYIRKNRKFDYDGSFYMGTQLNSIVQRNTAIDELLAQNHGDIVEDAIYKDIREVYLAYKKDKSFRNGLNDIIFSDIETLSINSKLSIAYTFIVYAILTLKNYHYLKKRNDPCYALLKNDYPTEQDLFRKISEVLKTADDLVDVTDCCLGRYRFVDYHLSKTEDIKLLPRMLVYSFIDDNSLIDDIMALKRG